MFFQIIILKLKKIKENIILHFYYWGNNGSIAIIYMLYTIPTDCLSLPTHRIPWFRFKKDENINFLIRLNFGGVTHWMSVTEFPSQNKQKQD